MSEKFKKAADSLAPASQREAGVVRDAVKTVKVGLKGTIDSSKEWITEKINEREAANENGETWQEAYARLGSPMFESAFKNLWFEVTSKKDGHILGKLVFFGRDSIQIREITSGDTFTIYPEDVKRKKGQLMIYSSRKAPTEEEREKALATQTRREKKYADEKEKVRKQEERATNPGKIRRRWNRVKKTWEDIREERISIIPGVPPSNPQ